MILRYKTRVKITAALLVGVVLLFVGYAYSQRNNLAFRVKLVPIARAVRNLSNVLYAKYYFQESKLDTIRLEIDEEDLAELVDNLPPPYSKEILTDEYKQEKKAILVADDKEYQVRVRYRGDLSNHWSGEKKSWQIELRGDELFQGMSEFNLTIPEDRDYILEEYNQWRARQLGLLVPHSEFVELSVNGGKRVTYWLHEHWSKELLSKQGVPDGATIYGSEDGGDEFGKWKPIFESPSYWQTYTENEYAQFDDYAPIAALLELLESDDTTFAKNIFSLIDEENFYAWNIHATVAASDHQNSWNNMRLYFNPAIGKFQFIPWDVNQWAPGESIDRDYNPIVTRILSVPEYRHKRDMLLWKQVAPEEVEKKLQYFDQLWDDVKVSLYKDGTKPQSNWEVAKTVEQHRKWIIANAQNIRNQLDDTRVMAQVGFQDSAVTPLKVTVQVLSKPILQFAKISIASDNGATPVAVFRDVNNNGIIDANDYTVGEFVYDDSDERYEAEFDTELLYSNIVYKEEAPYFAEYELTEFAYIITGSKRFNPVHTSNVGFDPVHTEVDLKVENTVTQKKIDIDDEYELGSQFDLLSNISLSKQDFLRTYSQFNNGESDQVVLDGTVYFDSTVVIPNTVTVVIQPGTVMMMAPDVSIFSYARVLAQGLAEQPIILSSNSDQPWGVFLVTGNKASGSVFEYIRLSNSSEAYINGLFVSGGLAIHDAGTATVTSSYFTSTFGDDALNYKYTEGEITNTTFENTGFDALDVDFASPVIRDNIFRNIGNDGIDVSFSGSIITNNVLQNLGDKGLSLGESSTVTVVNNRIQNATIGIAVKDNSDVVISNVTVRDVREGVSIYEKKPVFGGAKALVVNSLLWTDVSFVVKNNSTLEQHNNNTQDAQGTYSIQPDFVADSAILAASESGQVIAAGGDASLVPQGITIPDSLPIGSWIQ